MAQERLTDRTAITYAQQGDLLHLVDVSDTTDNASGTSKKITVNNLLNNGVNVLQFITVEADRTKVISRDNSQSATNVTAGINAAITYCSSNNIKELHFGDGLYIIDKVTFNGLDDFRLIGHGATIQYNSGDSIFNFTNCEDVFISGFHFTSTESSYSDVAFIRAETGCAYFKIFANKFTNFPRAGILANTLEGGVFTEGFTIYMNEFVDTPNYSNVNQCGIELGDDGEYSKVINNNFYSIPSAIRFVNGANGLFAYNNCMLSTGTAYTTSYLNAIVYADDSGTNSGKIDIIYNKINHNDQGDLAIVYKGDSAAPQNAIKIIGNDILVHGSLTKAKAIYISDADYSIIKDNKIRGRVGTPNDTAITIKDSPKVVLDDLFIQYFDYGVELITSSGVSVGTMIYEDIDTTNFVFDSGSADFIFSEKTPSLESISSGKTISNDDFNKTIYNYTSGSLAVTIPTSGLMNNLTFKLDAVSSDITVSEGSNEFLPSGDKTIAAGDYAIVYKDGSTNKFRFLQFADVGGTVSLNDGSAELAAIESEATTQGFTQPSSGTKTALQTFIADLITAGAWDAADLILMFSYNDTNVSNFCRINLKSPTDTLATLTNSPTYSVNGFAGNGTNAYIDTNYNPSTYGGNFTQNDATRIAVLFSATSNTGTALNRIDGVTTGTNNLMVNANSTLMRINTTSNLGASFDATGTGLKGITRQDASNITLYNGATSSATTSTSAAPDNENLLIFRDRTNYGDCGIGLYITGSDMSSMMSDIRTAYNTYLTTISLSAFA